MESKVFINNALKQLINRSKPFERLSSKNKAIYGIDENEGDVGNGDFIIDVHCHLFDVKTVNIRYFLIRLLKDFIGMRSNEAIITIEDPNINYLKASENTLNTEGIYINNFDSDEEWDLLKAEIEYIEEKKISVNENLFRIGELKTRGFTDIWKAKKLLSLDKMEDVYKFYLENFALNKMDGLGAKLKNKDLFVTALMMDLETGWGVKTRKSFEEQILEYIELGQHYPILPFFKCDPRRANLYELFLQAFPSQGPSFFGVKIYPGLGYSPSDYRLKPIFEVCEKMNIPVITHCGGESVTTNTNHVNIFRGHEEVELVCDTRQQVASILNHPKEWESVLKEFPKLKLNLGHFGGDTAWKEKRDSGTSEKVDKAIELMSKYDGVYADFSYNLIDFQLETIYISTINSNEKLKDKALFGTDYWVVIPAGDLKNRQTQFLKNIETSSNGLLKRITNLNTRKFLFGTIDT